MSSESEHVVVTCEADDCDYDLVAPANVEQALRALSCPACSSPMDINESKAAHTCDETTADHVIVESGEACPFCEATVEVALADGSGTATGDMEREEFERRVAQEIEIGDLLADVDDAIRAMDSGFVRVTVEPVTAEKHRIERYEETEMDHDGGAR